MPREIVRFEINKPVEVALEFQTGKAIDGKFGQRIMYSLVGQKVMYLDPGPSIKVSELRLEARETFFICKGAKHFDMWLSPATEKKRAIEEMAQAEPEPTESDLQRQLRESLILTEARKAAASASAASPVSASSADRRGTGTYGPVAVPSFSQQPQAMPSWGANLLAQTNELTDVYAQACIHAEEQGVPLAAVRTFMLSAFIGLQKSGGR